MRQKHVKTGAAVSSGAGARVSAALDKGRYAGLQLSISGTTDTAQTLDEADVGRIRIQRFGDQIAGAKFEFYFDLSNLIGGFPHKTAPTAGASRITTVIPFYLDGLPTTLDVGDSEEVVVYLDFSDTLATRFGANAATYKLHGLVAPGIPERYELHVAEQDIVAVGSGRYPSTLKGGNIGAIYMRDAGDVVDQVHVEIDDEVAVDNIDTESLLDLTTFSRRVEAAAGGLIEIHNAPGGALAETRNRDVSVDAQFSGTGTLELWKFRVVPSDKADSSISDVQTRLRAQAGGRLQRPRARPAGARG